MSQSNLFFFNLDNFPKCRKQDSKDARNDIMTRCSDDWEACVFNRCWKTAYQGCWINRFVNYIIILYTNVTDNLASNLHTNKIHTHTFKTSIHRT